MKHLPRFHYLLTWAKFLSELQQICSNLRLGFLSSPREPVLFPQLSGKQPVYHLPLDVPQRSRHFCDLFESETLNSFVFWSSPFNILTVKTTIIYLFFPPLFPASTILHKKHKKPLHDTVVRIPFDSLVTIINPSEKNPRNLKAFSQPLTPSLFSIISKLNIIRFYTDTY